MKVETYQQLSFLMRLKSDCLARAMTISSVKRDILCDAPATAAADDEDTPTGVQLVLQLVNWPTASGQINENKHWITKQVCHLQIPAAANQSGCVFKPLANAQF